MTKDDDPKTVLWKTLPGPAHKIIYAACMSRSPEIKLNSDFVPSLPSLTLPTDYQKRRVWLLRALPDEENRRSEAGLVYDDDLEHRYSFSNRVPNYKRVKPGDLVLLRDNSLLLGAAVIEQIRLEARVHEVYRCPRCSSSRLVYRKREKDWRCDGQCVRQDGLSADERSHPEPLILQEEGTFYTAEFGETWSDLAGTLMAQELPELADRWNRQNSIVELNPSKVLAFFDSLKFSVRQNIDVSGASLGQDGFTERMVRARRGQTQFRAHLLKRFGEICAFSGPCYRVALEAAHLYSYAETGRHQEGGGLLMRRDLHRLFDEGLVGVTNRARIAMHADLQSGQYARFQDQPLQVSLGKQEKVLLAKHYEKHSHHLVTG